MVKIQASWVKFQIKETKHFKVHDNHLSCLHPNESTFFFSIRKHGLLRNLCQLGHLTRAHLSPLLLKWHSFILSCWIGLFNPLITIPVHHQTPFPHHKSLLVYQKRQWWCSCMLSRLVGWSCWLFAYWKSELDLMLSTANFNLTSFFVSQLCWKKTPSLLVKVLFFWSIDVII